ncbi:hypothetical protein KIPB_010380 [Kipferlia bialata]|uniref:Uncharacterized protein n=1 Tax=Kipferlia bialata TaxID=797122 RepID=A0A391NU46_9EUKA|nr:hypothetical protein KIPB_010380 [Kipferlia bialata]|eukprot:g10380.t1
MEEVLVPNTGSSEQKSVDDTLAEIRTSLRYLENRLYEETSRRQLEETRMLCGEVAGLVVYYYGYATMQAAGCEGWDDYIDLMHELHDSMYVVDYMPRESRHAQWCRLQCALNEVDDAVSEAVGIDMYVVSEIALDGRRVPPLALSIPQLRTVTAQKKFLSDMSVYVCHPHYQYMHHISHMLHMLQGVKLRRRREDDVIAYPDG